MSMIDSWCTRVVNIITKRKKQVINLTKENILRKECIDSSPKQYVTSEHSPKLVYKTSVLMLFIVLDEL